jgi:hypothetical protein
LNRLTMFSWGYWGWGTATQQLIASVDAAERKRGFNPPIFVDIRNNRSVRAPGFNGRAFEDLLGWRRYRWMPSLGNMNIGKSKPTRIACPTSATQLLDVALEARLRSARVIFFCACESPSWAEKCHRHKVAGMVKRAARSRRISLDLREWAAEQPRTNPVVLRVSPQILSGVVRGAKSVPLKGKRMPVAWCGIPWGTLVILKTGSNQVPVAVGPAAYRHGQWVLPLFQDEKERAGDVVALRRQSAKLRAKYGL